MKRYTNTGKDGFLSKYIPSITIILLVIAWEISVKHFKTPEYILPAPSLVIKVFKSTYKLILSHSAVTVKEALAGFGISIIVGVLLSFIMNRWNIVKRALYPLMVISQTVPIIALAPLIIIWLGVGTLPKVVIVVLVCFFPICVNTTEGLQSADADLINLMKVMGAGPLRILTEVKLPSALPQFFSGLKIAATYSIMGAVIGEWLGARAGLGIFMTRVMSSHRADMLFAAIVVIVVLSVAMFKLIEIAEKIAVPWNSND